MSVALRERFRGCLVGQCLGDALGFPVEGYPPEITRDYVEQTLRAGYATGAGRGPWAFGQYTDDSQLARELLHSFVDHGDFDPTDYAQRIACIFSENRVVGRGLATEEAARRLSSGVPWQEAGARAPSAGNGSAMRAAPVGLMFHDQPERLFEVACNQSRITHQDPRCLAGSVAIAAATALALEQATPVPAKFLSELAALVARADSGFATALEQLGDWLALEPGEAVGHIAAVGLDPGYEPDWPGISPFVLGSVLWSLYSFLRTPDDYWETVCTAIAVGGDVDTTAAMAGAISGAHVGIEALPGDLSERLNDSGTWGLPELIALADRAHDLKPG